MDREQDGWKTEIRQECKNREFNSFPRSMGTVSPPSAKTGNHKIRVGGTDSHQSNPFTSKPGEGSIGGVARQLIEETQKQLDYHRLQVQALEARLNELKQITDDLEQK